jgi:hypothetical protein
MVPIPRPFNGPTRPFPLTDRQRGSVCICTPHEFGSCAEDRAESPTLPSPSEAGAPLEETSAGLSNLLLPNVGSSGGRTETIYSVVTIRRGL